MGMSVRYVWSATAIALVLAVVAPALAQDDGFPHNLWRAIVGVFSPAGPAPSPSGPAVAGPGQTEALAGLSQAGQPASAPIYTGTIPGPPAAPAPSQTGSIVPRPAQAGPSGPKPQSGMSCASRPS